MLNNEFCMLSIIIVSYNSSSYLKDCIDSLLKYRPLFQFEIIVVDNASTDDSVHLVEKNYPYARLIINKRNMGFAAANNIAIRKSNSKYLLLINSDCEVYENSIQAMVSYMEDNAGTGIVGPKIKNTDGSIQLSCRKFPSFFDAGMHTLLHNIAPDNRFSRRYKLAEIERSAPVEVDWVSGSCILIRRKSLDDTGLMDERYFMYVEDTDLCFQMWKKGWKVIYNPYSEILHHIGGSTRSGEVSSSVRMQKSALYFFWKNYKKTWRVLLLPLVLLLLGIRIFLTFIKNLLQ
jgi:GT2 family glycosyltransferase